MLGKHPIPTWRPAAWAVMALLACAVTWAAVTRLDEVAVAGGEVVPRGQVKVIQHLEGGIVERIEVVEGSSVQPGDPLIRLNLGAGGLNPAELQARLDALTLNLDRVRAEAEGLEPEFSPDVAARRPEFVRAERQAFEARRGALQSRLAVLSTQLQQRQSELGEHRARRASLRAGIELAKEELRMSADLLKDGLVPKMEHVRRERELEELSGDLAALEQKIPRAAAAIEELRETERETRLKFVREAKEELGRVQVAMAQVREVLAQADDQERRTVILSPIEGVVKNLRYNTIGGVVGAAEPIMEIVPSHDRLIVEARLNPVDRGYVRVGQRAVVKVSTYDFFRYGGLEGQVARIAADSDTDQQGLPYYEVVVETERSELGDEANPLPIQPGMQATVDIHTGDKSVLEYLVRPVLKLRHEAFRER